MTENAEKQGIFVILSERTKDMVNNIFLDSLLLHSLT